MKDEKLNSILHPSAFILCETVPGRIRTSDLLIRSQTLYPAELRAHKTLILNADGKDYQTIPLTGPENYTGRFLPVQCVFAKKMMERLFVKS